EIIVDQRPLKQVETVWPFAVETLESGKYSLLQEHVAIKAQDTFTARLAKDQVARRRRPHGVRGQNVPAPRRAFDKRARGLAAEVVDDQAVDPLHVLIKPQGLEREG